MLDFIYFSIYFQKCKNVMVKTHKKCQKNNKIKLDVFG